MVELASTLSPNHRLMPAEYRRVGYLTNGWNAVRRWNSRSATLQTAGIEGPSINEDAWVPYSAEVPNYPPGGTKYFRYRYMDSSTGYVSDASNEVEIIGAANTPFLIGAPTAVLGPGSLAFTAGTVTRAAGSFVTDGFAIGDYVTLASCEDAANNGTWGPIVALTATVMTIATQPFTVNAADTAATWQRAAKGRIQPSTDTKVDTIILEASENITLAEVESSVPYGPDATGLVFTLNTVTRQDGGSFLTDGFEVGNLIRFNGLELGPPVGASGVQNVIFGPITAITASAMTIDGYFLPNAQDTAATWLKWTRTTVGEGAEFFKSATALNTAATITHNVEDAFLETQVLQWPSFHEPPPITKNVLSYRDRLWYYSQVVHDTGTATVTNGSANVAQGSTAPDWNNEALGSSAGDSSVEWLFQRDGDAEVYEISYYTGTEIVLKKVYAGVTGANVGYKIFSRANVIWVSEPGYPESFNQASFLNGPNGEAAGDITAGCGFQGSILFFSQSTIHRFSWGDDPFTNGSMIPLTSKAGALTQRVVVEHEGMVYTMDRRGWHRFDGLTPTLISRPLGAILPLIDFDRAEFFHACYLPDSRAIRWWVCYTGETYPKHYVQLDVDTGAWSTGAYLQGMTDSRLVRQGDGLRLFLIDENGHEWWGETGLADGCPAANSHVTAAPASTTTVIQVDEVLPTTGVGLAGCYLSRKIAAGATESRRITSNTAGAITCEAFSGAPADGDLLWVGMIPSKLRTRAYGYEKDLKAKTRTGHLVVCYNPVASPRYLQVRVYEDYSLTPKTWSTPRGAVLEGLTKPSVNVRYPIGDWLIDLSLSHGLVTIPIGSEWKRWWAVEFEIEEPDADFQLIALEFDGQALGEVGQ